jgi:hypothetical protein
MIQTKKPPTFRQRFLPLAKDGKARTVAQIRHELRLTKTSNVGECLRSLQCTLAGEKANIRLKSRAERSKSHRRLWWVEVRGKAKNL